MCLESFFEIGILVLKFAISTYNKKSYNTNTFWCNVDKALILCCTLLLPSLSFAQVQQCDLWHDVAHNIMAMYQHNVPMADALAAVEQQELKTPIDTLMVEVAYETEKFNSLEQQDKAANDFAQHMYTYCLRF